MNTILEIDSRGVARVTLNRPDVHNAFNDQMIAELIGLFSELDKNESVRLVVLTGAGASFCAGADLNWMKRMKDYSFDENLADSQKLAELFNVLNGLGRPVIACVNGNALGGGAGLIAACDYVLASESASIGFTEVRLGLVPAVISPFVIAKIGESHARASFLSGARFDVHRALSMGLVHQISTKENFNTDLDNLINEFLMAAPVASALAKKLVAEVVHAEESTELRNFTCSLISKVRASEEGQEGMNALLEKRKARWL